MSERLVEFLYTLARDELPMGDIEEIMWNFVTGDEPDEYCNPWLEAWARDLAKRLTDETVPVTNYNNMYKAGGAIGHKNRVFGPDAKKVMRPPYAQIRS